MASAATGGQGEESADPHLYGCENKGVAGEAIRIVMKAKGEQKTMAAQIRTRTARLGLTGG